MDVRVKICGLTRREDVAAAARAGAVYGGFVFFPRSPRAVSVAAARALALEAPVGLAKVGLMVDAGGCAARRGAGGSAARHGAAAREREPGAGGGGAGALPGCR